MSIVLLPDIEGLDPESLCYSIYIQLYHNFFNAQDKGCIVEGDDTSIRLRNTAYNIASAIAGSVAGDGSEGGGGVLLGYLKKSGGDMIGMLRANYGFEAGIGNTRLIETYKEIAEDGVTPIYGMQFLGDVRIGGANLFLGGRQIIRYSTIDKIAYIENPFVSFAGSTLLSKGEMIFGESKETGLFLSPTTIRLKDKVVYHEGNANLETINWSMLNGLVSGDLNVKGKTSLFGMLSALRGAELGSDSKVILSIRKGEAQLDGFLNIAMGCGVKIGDVPVLFRINETDVELSVDNGNLHLGSDKTQKIKLFANLSDIDGDNILITKYGGAYFPDSLRVAHNYGAVLLSTYRASDADEGIILHKKLRFGFADGLSLSGNRAQLVFSQHTNQTTLGFRKSTSLYQLPESGSISLYIDTNCDFITFDKPIESKRYLGIDGSFTRLTDKHLYFSSEHYLMSATDGMKHFGNAYFIDSLGSERFSSGFAGYGWAILKNLTTGNIAATFDELTIRKKMRIYELEVQKFSATNGSLWVSDSCSGDRVERIN